MSESRTVDALRAIVLDADTRVEEGVKWNSPSFHIGGEHFATLRLGGKAGVQLVLHLGAKPRPDATVRESVPDPDGLLEWKSADRAVVTFADGAAVERARASLPAILRGWIASR